MTKVTDITYDADACYSDMTLGYDVIQIQGSHVTRLGTYDSKSQANREVDAYTTRSSLSGIFDVIQRF